MFDRIAGVYDRMNSVMTAGLHHQWRRRAADLAAAGARASGRWTWPPAPATWRSSWRAGWRPAGRSSAPTSPSGCSSWRVTRRSPSARRSVPARRRSASRPPTRWRSPTTTTSFDAATVGFGARNFSDLRARPARDGPRRAPRRAGRGAGDHHPARGPPLSTFLELWFDRIVPVARARSPATPTPTATCPTRSAAFPRPQALAAVMWECGLRPVRYVITAGGIIALHVGEVA